MIIREVHNKYSFIDKISLFFTLIKTKLLYPKSRLVRENFCLRGKCMINLGTSLTTGKGCRIEAFQTEIPSESKYKIKFGDRIQINDYVHISAMRSVEIGNDVLIASHVYISDNSHGIYKEVSEQTSPYVPPIKRPYFVLPVKIGSRVWLGEGVIIMPGVKIGDGAIIGAHSIVNKDIPPNSIAVGSPAKVVKVWDEENGKWIKTS